VQLLAKLNRRSLSDASRNHWTPLHHAAHRGFPECVEVLIQNHKIAGFDISEETRWGWTPLHMAAYSGDEKCVILLLKAGADRTKKKACQRKVILFGTPAQVSKSQHIRDIINEWSP
jgi:ankyrin repeat protein